MAKTTKSGKANKSLVSGGMIVVVVAVILIIACFFTYISGILPQTLTGITITENNPDGTSKNIKNYSVLESNFHFKEVYDSYSQYGMVSADTLDNVSNQETGDTYRDVILREAAGQMKTLTLVERAAKESGFMEISKSREIAAKNLETLDLYARLYGYPSGQSYLKALYGTGMTKRLYTDFAAREVLVNEYGSYLKQFDPSIVPSDDAVLAKYNEDTSIYSTLDYNLYFIKAETDKDGKVVGMDAAVKAANKIADATKDSASFRDAVLEYVKGTGDDAAVKTFDNGADPTLTKDFTYSVSTYMEAAVKDYLFSDSKTGDKKVIQTEFGAYVIYIANKDNGDGKTVTYRLLTLSADFKSDDTDDVKAAALQKTMADAQTMCPSGMDPLSFYKLVTDKTTNLNDKPEGGYNIQDADYFVSTESNPIDPSVVEAGKWLFDDARKQGDVFIIASEDKQTVYVFYFEAARPAWDVAIRNDMIAANFNDWNSKLDTGNYGYVINAGLVRYLVY